MQISEAPGGRLTGFGFLICRLEAGVQGPSSSDSLGTPSGPGTLDSSVTSQLLVPQFLQDSCKPQVGFCPFYLTFLALYVTLFGGGAVADVISEDEVILE